MPSRCLLALFALVLCSCASDSPENFRLRSKADTNPDPIAIVGLWHRRAFRETVLFRPDGTGIASHYGNDATQGAEDGFVVKFTWEYKGGGVWRAKSARDWSYPMWAWRVADGKLLRNSDPPFSHAQVFERVEE
jgi:hypothetical protein